MDDVKLQNDQLPANFQDIDDITDIDALSFDELGDLYERVTQRVVDINSMAIEIKKTIYDKQKVDSKKTGCFLSLKTYTKTFPDLTIDDARELGLTKIVPEKESIDNAQVKKAHANGVDLGKMEMKTGHTMRKIKEEQPEA